MWRESKGLRSYTEDKLQWDVNEIDAFDRDTWSKMCDISTMSP